MNKNIVKSKKLLLSIMIGGLSFGIAKAQFLTPSIVSTTGDYYANATGSLSYTIGEPIIETYSGGSNILTQGFQQTDYSFVGVQNVTKSDIQISVYPNPFASTFTLNNMANVQLFAQITDMTGKVIYQRNLVPGNNMINPGNLADAIYLLTVTDNTGAKVQTIKIVRNR